jgi:hypothetical protein
MTCSKEWKDGEPFALHQCSKDDGHKGVCKCACGSVPPVPNYKLVPTKNGRKMAIYF